MLHILQLEQIMEFMHFTSKIVAVYFHIYKFAKLHFLQPHPPTKKKKKKRKKKRLQQNNLIYKPNLF